MIGPTPGADGVNGSFMTTFSEAAEMQRVSSETVNVYVPGSRPETTVLVPVSVVTTLPGDRVSVHMPEEGSPVNVTLPVG